MVDKNKTDNSVLYGFLAGAGLLFFYLSVLTLFENFDFALSNLRSLWYWLVSLAVGFGMQIGLYSSIKHNAVINSEIASTGTISGGSMVACCSHFILNIIPVIGFSGLATFLMSYQKLFFGIGIISNAIGIGILLNHKRKCKISMFPDKNSGKRKMNKNFELKENKFSIKNETHLKGGK